ncbi:aliphatic sulfonate ABC transporter substrate-binding protein [Aliidiomarina maris]|uniref:Putative aliphatic sulfonates-binding protein n=1 Tax=Aliidiomarina maris TaxID=531312 RepID=A0A327X382_9GAMM|nr:aliphatic sulfonate ABC transporter substrate-binding protein [Aliidiomarina maris]RAK01407.1 sulfonate transport system substrate-binding protein [Aliidiomarina maris]RUO28254.1 aliphatic sulfonates ABC transporter substrate-binding protein [Aliidiomarina maris]
MIGSACRLWLFTAVLSVFSFAVDAAPQRVSLDYAYYNPLSLLLKEQGWLEEALADKGVEVRWVHTQGSNRALEFLRAGAIDFGSTAGSAALVGRANGLPIEAIYQYSQPEWTALVTTQDSTIRSVADLRGKRVAVTRGTDPHIFLLRALADAGLTERDIQTVLLQHADGYNALLRGQVDAWAGLDPHMARAELEADAVLFHRQPQLNTYGLLNVREAFAQQHPEIVRTVIAAYERARHYALDNPEALQQVLVEAARISPDVAKLQLERTDISQSDVHNTHRQLLRDTGEVLQSIGILRPRVDLESTITGLVPRDTQHAEGAQ